MSTLVSKNSVSCKGGTPQSGATLIVEAGTIYLGSNAKIVVASGGTLWLKGNSTLQFGSGATVENNGTVRVDDEIAFTIPVGGNLVGGAGAQFIMGSGSSLSINGSLSATGTESQRVVFSSLNPPNRWDGITAPNSYQASVSLDYVNITNTTGALTIGEFANFTMDNCIVDDFIFRIANHTIGWTRAFRSIP